MLIGHFVFADPIFVVDSTVEFRRVAGRSVRLVSWVTYGGPDKFNFAKYTTAVTRHSKQQNQSYTHGLFQSFQCDRVRNAISRLIRTNQHFRRFPCTFNPPLGLNPNARIVQK